MLPDSLSLVEGVLEALSSITITLQHAQLYDLESLVNTNLANEIIRVTGVCGRIALTNGFDKRL